MKLQMSTLKMKKTSISHEQATQNIYYKTQEGKQPIGEEPKVRETKNSKWKVEVVDVDVVDEDSPNKKIDKDSKIKELESDAQHKEERIEEL